MFNTIVRAFRVKETRKKVLYTMMILLVFRFGSAIPVPFLNPEMISNVVNESGSFLGLMNLYTGGGLSKATLFAMSITPYINASIIVQLLTVAIPSWEKMQREGEEGRKKLNKITRYLAVALGLIQAIGYYFLLKVNSGVQSADTTLGNLFIAAVIMVTFTAGTALIFWLGEQINEKGIGNGISIILFAGIISRLPDAFQSMAKMWALATSGQWQYFIYVPAIVLVFLAMVVFIVLLNEGERRIPVQYAKRVVGRRMYQGQSSHIPIKVIMSGVMPIIFASAILSIPSMIAGFLNLQEGTFWHGFFKVFNYNSWGYAIIYFILIIAFNFFYVAVQYNPIEIANNLRKGNGSIPGIRPGKPTSDYIAKVLWKIAMAGAICLGIIAVFPIIFTMLTSTNVALGGTSVIIIVGVALETVRVLESDIMMQKHKGFLE